MAAAAGVSKLVTDEKLQMGASSRLLEMCCSTASDGIVVHMLRGRQMLSHVEYLTVA